VVSGRRTGEAACVKVLRVPSAVMSDEERDLLNRELLALQGLPRHSNIVEMWATSMSVEAGSVDA